MKDNIFLQIGSFYIKEDQIRNLSSCSFYPFGYGTGVVAPAIKVTYLDGTFETIPFGEVEKDDLNIRPRIEPDAETRAVKKAEEFLEDLFDMK